MGQSNDNTAVVQDAQPGFAVTLTGKLPLPLPDYLDNGEAFPIDVQDFSQAIGTLLESTLAGSDDVLPHLSVRAMQALTPVTAGLTHKQRAYDDYFDVERVQGGSNITLLSMVPVLGGLATELHAGSSLTVGDTERLMDGLQALLETLNDTSSDAGCSLQRDADGSLLGDIA